MEEMLELKNRIIKLEEEKEYLLTDIEDTQRAMQDKYVSYMDKKEYENDIIADRRRIAEIDQTIIKISNIVFPASDEEKKGHYK